MIAVVIVVNIFIGSVINTVIFLIGLKILDRFGEGGLWIDPKQTVIRAFWFVPSITVVTTFLRLLPMGWIIGLIVWVIALMLVYRMEWYEMGILAIFFSFAGFVISMLQLPLVD
jgi:hypothetical protein